MKSKAFVFAILGALLLLLAACTSASQLAPSPSMSPSTPTVTAQTTAASQTTANHTPTLPPPTPTPTATPTLTPTATPLPSATPTPDPYAELAIAHLLERSYGGGELRIERELGSNESFTRSLFTYTSEGLTIYGFMNVPLGTGPFPVALVLHGYIPPENYDTLAYTTRYADALARAGYVVLHPNLRNFPPSDEGPDPLRINSAIDVLNLIALVRAQAGQPGALEAADASRIGIMGHSMGGGIATRVMVVDPSIRAVVLYGAMSADERQNIEKIIEWSGGTRGNEEAQIGEADLARISPVTYLERIGAAVSIHHSEDDQTVPIQWSREMCARLEALGEAVECFTYTDTPHTFRGEADQLFMQRTIAFFDRYVRAEEQP